MVSKPISDLLAMVGLNFLVSSSMPADVLDLERRFSAVSTQEQAAAKGVPKASDAAAASSSLSQANPSQHYPVTQAPSSSQSSQPQTQAPTQPHATPTHQQNSQPTAKQKASYKNMIIGFNMIQKIGRAFDLNYRIIDDAFALYVSSPGRSSLEPVSL